MVKILEEHIYLFIYFKILNYANLISNFAFYTLTSFKLTLVLLLHHFRKLECLFI